MQTVCTPQERVVRRGTYYRYNVRVHNYQVVDSGDLSGVLDLLAHPSILLRCGVCVVARINTVHWEDAGYLK